MTEKELNAQFWVDHPELTHHKGWKQNQYPADTRMAYVAYVDSMERSGSITRKVAMHATLHD